jgi:hypothetical protein
MMDGSPLIQIPTLDELPIDLRPTGPAGAMRFELPDIDRSTLPRVVGFKLAVLPVCPPKETEGGIALPLESVRNMQIMRTTGVVVRVGPLAFGQQRGWPDGYRSLLGLDTATPDRDIWVQFQAHAGQDVPLATRDGTEQVSLKYLNDADILAVFDCAADAQAFTVLI